MGTAIKRRRLRPLRHADETEVPSTDVGGSEVREDDEMSVQSVRAGGPGGVAIANFLRLSDSERKKIRAKLLLGLKRLDDLGDKPEYIVDLFFESLQKHQQFALVQDDLEVVGPSVA